MPPFILPVPLSNPFALGKISFISSVGRTTCCRPHITAKGGHSQRDRKWGEWAHEQRRYAHHHEVVGHQQGGQLLGQQGRVKVGQVVMQICVVMVSERASEWGAEAASVNQW